MPSNEAKFKIPEKCVHFGSIPINITSKKSFAIINEGINHLFGQITDSSPCAGVVVNPTNDLVSTGLQTSITIEVTPIELIKFDIKFGLRVLGEHEQEIYMTGEVIEPNLNIPESEINYGGVSILMKASK
ncbi:unnamed protein product [Rotaria sp. Silwood1]|nr:unnamed protein product [Rotaria sp. Silwood1]CAF1605587.1 unnamed protein product [Rotaria sp. Silwood1]CAF4975162.1 unnamed protein product [Rotaria sp. Silwood1]